MSRNNPSFPKAVRTIVRNENGAFDFFIDDVPDRANIASEYLEEETCSRFGYCGEEFRELWVELEANGRVTLPY